MIDRLRSVLEADPRIAYAILFGSRARGGVARTDSDTDVAVALTPGVAYSALQIGDLVSQLEAAAGTRVDVVLLDEARPGLAYRIFRDGTLLFVRDPHAVVDRKARAILEYLDFQPIEQILARGALKAARIG